MNANDSVNVSGVIDSAVDDMRISGGIYNGEDKLEDYGIIANTYVYLIVSTVLIFLIYKLLFKSSKKTAKDSILIAGPTNSGKTAFFYNLIGMDNIKETVTSMEMNVVENYQIQKLDSTDRFCIIDFPGQGFYKTRIVDTIPNAKAIIVFLDSTEKPSITQAAEYLYDILNNEHFDETIPLIVACNKQDLKFPKSKKIVESDLNAEIENIKQIKQKNNLEETSQMGALFSLRTKFNFTMFKNVQFVETDKASKFESLVNLLKTLV